VEHGLRTGCDVVLYDFQPVFLINCPFSSSYLLNEMTELLPIKKKPRSRLVFNSCNDSFAYDLECLKTLALRLFQISHETSTTP
jgi:hypothetical protein